MRLWFLRIATAGTSERRQRRVLPLYPLAIRAVSSVIGAAVRSRPRPAGVERRVLSGRCSSCTTSRSASCPRGCAADRPLPAVFPTAFFFLGSLQRVVVPAAVADVAFWAARRGGGRAPRGAGALAALTRSIGSSSSPRSGRGRHQRIRADGVPRPGRRGDRSSLGPGSALVRGLLGGARRLRWPPCTPAGELAARRRSPALGHPRYRAHGSPSATSGTQRWLLDDRLAGHGGDRSRPAIYGMAPAPPLLPGVYAWAAC